MTGLLFFILFIIGFIEMLCVGNMSSGPFTSGFVAYTESFSIKFDKAHTLTTKKLKERLDRNLDWMSFHEYELRRLNVREIIFTERQFQFLAHGGPQILHGHIILDPINNKFTIFGRLSKTVLLLLPVLGYAFASEADSIIEAIGIFIMVIATFVILIKYSISKYYVVRYKEVANAIMDVLEEPNKSFKYAPYRSRDLTNRSPP